MTGKTDTAEKTKSNAIEAIKRNINTLNSIVLLIVFTLLLVNIRFLYSFLSYINPYSVGIMLFIVSGLVIASLYLSTTSSKKAIKHLEEYDNKINALLVSMQKEITERRRAEEQLEHQAFHDQLTNLPNRAMFMKLLKRLLDRPKRHKDYIFAVLFMDLDRFKIINDSLGHIKGDQLLVDVTQRLKGCLRPVDTVARFGGDEFAILIDDIKEITDALLVADRIQEKLTLPFNLGGQEVFSTVSIGIALSATGYQNEADILRDADAAMYRAKAHGRARYELFDTKMHTIAMRDLKLEADLRQAVERGEFLLYYQPVVSLTESRITGVEALLRWQHPERGIILPAEFIPVAEEAGVIVKIGEWVLRIACAQNKMWQDAGHQLLCVKVNFSARQFQQENCLEFVKDVLQETGLPPHALEIEITESIAMQDYHIETLNELCGLGIKTSIDDFGIGYSSLGSLKRFPIDSVKIDKSFIKDITTDHNAKAIVTAIIAMAHSLKMKVVAEGVETKEQLAFLHSLRCDEIQGYLFSLPVPCRELTNLLSDKQQWDLVWLALTEALTAGDLHE